MFVFLFGSHTLACSRTVLDNYDVMQEIPTARVLEISINIKSIRHIQLGYNNLRDDGRDFSTLLIA